MSVQLQLLDLPEIIFEHILSFLTYDEIAKNRLVCKKFDTSCRFLLNRGFLQAERRLSDITQVVKHRLPRRESKRRTHSLASHSEILSALGTRISTLSMTFMKFIQAGVCCFIPGKVIDEIYHILDVVQNNPKPPITEDLLQELRDISIMAMEHFKEHIEPSLKNKECVYKEILIGSQILQRSVLPEVLQKEHKIIFQRTRAHKYQLLKFQKTIGKMSYQISQQKKLLSCQTSKIREQNKTIRQQSSEINEIKEQLQQLSKNYENILKEINVMKIVEHKSSQTTLQVETLNQSLPNITLHDELEARITKTLSETYSYEPKYNKRTDIIKPRFRTIVKPGLKYKYLKNIHNIKPRVSFQSNCDENTDTYSLKQLFTKYQKNIIDDDFGNIIKTNNNKSIDLQEYKINKSSDTDIEIIRKSSPDQFINCNNISLQKEHDELFNVRRGRRRTRNEETECIVKQKTENKTELNAANVRKRKIINMIVNVIDSKVSKNNEDDLTTATTATDQNFENKLESNVKNKRHLKDIDSVPSKRFADNVFYNQFIE